MVDFIGTYIYRWNRSWWWWWCCVIYTANAQRLNVIWSCGIHTQREQQAAHRSAVLYSRSFTWQRSDAHAKVFNWTEAICSTEPSSSYVTCCCCRTFSSPILLTRLCPVTFLHKRGQLKRHKSNVIALHSLPNSLSYSLLICLGWWG